MKAFWRKHFIVLELMTCSIIFAGIIIWAEQFQGIESINKLVKGNRAELYSSLASIFGALLGFAITAVSIMISFAHSPKLKIVRESGHYKTLWIIFTYAIRASALATLTSVLALLNDCDDSPSRIMMYIALFFSMLATWRIARCIWILERIIELVIAPQIKQ